MNPILLHPDSPHHAHRRLIESVDGSFVQADSGGVVERIQSAYTTDLSGEIVIAEGAAPLFEAAWMKIFGNLDTLIYLAADEGLMNIVGDVDHYGTQEKIAHSWAYRYVDGVLGVSPRLVSEARTTGKPTRLVFPSTTEDRWETLGDIDPGLNTDQIFSIGSHTPNNNFVSLAGMEYDVDLIGEGTDKLDYPNLRGHGFLPEDEFLDFFRESSLFVMPATEQPFPVVVLEAMRAGIPSIVSNGTGTAPYLQTVHPKLARDTREIEESIEWYMELDQSDRKRLSESAREMANKFSPERSVRGFRLKYTELIKEL